MIAKYSNKNDFTATATYEGVKLTSGKTTLFAFKVLEGSTLGDSENFHTYQLTLLPSEFGAQMAVLIEQSHIDHVDVDNHVNSLACTKL